MGPPNNQLIDPPAGWAPDWLHVNFFSAIIEALGADTVCFVGGAVRDGLLGLSVSDIDMATSHRPDAVRRLLADASIKTIPTGLKHGTVTAVQAGRSCEITTLRRDVDTDGRHADVEFTDDWQADAERRDFTINALYLTPEGKIFDPVGGLADLRQKKVRFIGDAAQRIREDALRILRFYRFSARFAEEIDQAGQAACTNCIDLIDGLSVERVRDELLKIFLATDIMSTITLMDKSRVLQRVFGDEWRPAPIEAYCANEARLNAPVNSLVRLFMLSGSQLSASETASKFKLSGDDRRFLEAIEKVCRQQPVETAADIRRSFYMFGKPATTTAQVIQGSAAYGLVEQMSRDWVVPTFPLKGRDLIALGTEAGPKLGDALADLEQKWIASDFSLTKDQLLASFSP